MAEKKPFFSRKLLKVTPNGTYSTFGGSRKVRLFADRVELDSIQIYLPYLEELRSYGNVLKVRFVTGDGKPAEEYFRYDTFRPGTAVRELAAAVAEAARSWPGSRAFGKGDAGGRAATAGAVEFPARAARPEVRSETAADGRTRVTVPSGKVAFPLYCPICSAGATKVSPRRVSAGWNQRGCWLVPVCDRHEVGTSIGVEDWRPNATEVTLSFGSREYAQLFARANEAPRELKDVAGKDLAGSFGGTSFILYNYVVSLVYVSFLLTSRVHVLRDGESRVTPGLLYSLEVLLLGWWSLHGIVFSLRALTRNFRGGIDVSEMARAALAGIALSAYGL